MKIFYEFRAQTDGAQTPPPGPLVLITGFMGTGKSETGRKLAELLGLTFVDTDELIEKRSGKSIAEIFASAGEAHFRAQEAEICRELATRTDLVVATGGGTLLDEEAYNLLAARGTIFLLEASAAAIADRIGDGNARPLLEGDPAERITRLLAERQAAYHRIERRLNTTDQTPAQVAARIAAQLALPMARLGLEVPAGSLRRPPGAAPVEEYRSHIEIGRGLLSNLGARLKAHGLGRRALLLIAENVRAHFGAQIHASLDEAKIPWEELPLSDGDGAKTFAQAGEILAELARRGCTRDATAVTVGGGVTGDLGGFVAATFMRGIPFVQVPTTLLAQVDASIGGKVGVNLPQAKNLVGSFFHPALVLSDPCTLRTLPTRELSGGMAEVIKTALIGSEAFFDSMEHGLSHENALQDPAFLEDCVRSCAAVKAAVVERDPYEAGERRILNLGHTLGHAYEAVAHYEGFNHGEAIAVGLVAVLRIAVARGLADPSLLGRTQEMLRRAGLPVTPPAVDRATFEQSLQLDKKKRAGKLVFVLPVKPGTMAVLDDVTEAEIRAATEDER